LSARINFKQEINLFVGSFSGSLEILFVVEYKRRKLEFISPLSWSNRVIDKFD